MPLGYGDKFSGIIDLLKMKALRFSNDYSGIFNEEEIPGDFRVEAEDYRKRLIEKIAEADDAILERYLEGGELSQTEIEKGIKEGTLSRQVYPCPLWFCTEKYGSTAPSGSHPPLSPFTYR